MRPLPTIPIGTTSTVSILAFLALLLNCSQAQLFEIPFEERVGRSTLIIEGMVTEQFSFWDERHEMIYTSNLVRVTKVFVGEFSGTAIEIVTEGGQVGDVSIRFTETLELFPHDAGIFFCEPTRIRSGRTVDSDLHMQAFGSLQGFIRRNFDGSGGSPFLSWDHYDPEVYNDLVRLTGKGYREIAPFQHIGKSTGGGKGRTVLTAPLISSIVPQMRSAGTDSTITIAGSKFNPIRGTGNVLFKNADDGGASYIAPASTEYLVWSDTSIVVRVPTQAGSGVIKVANSDPDTTTSSVTLTIPYALLNATFSGKPTTTRFISRNPNGGLSWRMNTAFSTATLARDAFLRAMKKWRCSVSAYGGVHWDLGPATAADVVAYDGVNVVRFDIGNELPPGILGRCTSYYSFIACGTDSGAVVTELDIVFDGGASWYFGTGTPGGSQYDFESVSLHELGHAHQLAHVISNGAVMHYAIPPGATRRTLSSPDTAAANNVLRRSMVIPLCGFAGMSPVKVLAEPDTAICIGGSVNLRAYGGMTYLWNTGASDTLPMKTVSPTVTTSYIVTVTNGSCFSAADTVTVAVNPLPTANAGSDKAICTGDSTLIGFPTVDSVSTVGTAVGTTAMFPFRTNAEDQRAQMLFEAGELHAAGMRRGYITAVALNVAASANTKPMSNFSVAMKNTADTSLATGFRTGMNTVLSLTGYTPQVRWDTLYLDSAFFWDGVNNLVVQTCFDNSGTPSSSGYGVAVSQHPGYRVTYNYGNGGCSANSQYISFYRPLMKFIWQPYNYAWYPRTGLQRSIVSNPKASPAVTTTYILTVSDSSLCSGTDDAIVTVFPTDPTTLRWTGAVDTGWTTVGNWDAPCAVPSAGDTVIIPTGTVPPVTIPPISLGSLILDNISGLRLAGNLSIDDSLVLKAGHIRLGSYDLKIGGSGGISGGSPTAFIVTDGTGFLTQAEIGSGGRTGSILFPVGDSASRYSPLTVSNTGTADEFRARVSGTVLSGGTLGTPLSSHIVGKTWHIGESVSGGSSATLTFQWDGIVELPSFNRSNCAVARHDGSLWTTVTSYAQALGSNPYTRTAWGVSEFGPFAIGDPASPLPVEIVSFTARPFDGKVILHWITVSELNSLRYEIERRTVGEMGWNAVGSTPARGFSDMPVEYSFIDHHPPRDFDLQYRLRMVDRDGSAGFSEVLTVKISPLNEVTLHPAKPNPFRSVTEVSFSLPEEMPVHLDLFDVNGRRVRTLLNGMLQAGAHSFLFRAEGLPTGIYLLVLNTTHAVRTRRVLLER
ncbi:MAG: matrixin family metalloprotease [Bacteroidota bacterium]|nr:matrixin family metalloprotease [Bacteroidota bacterium]